MKLTEPQQIFKLPEWARWFAWIDVSPELKIQILSLKYPRWNLAFYPVYLNQNNLPLFDLPPDLTAVVKEGRVWPSCPLLIYYSEKTRQLMFDSSLEGDHPRPARVSRLLISPPDYKVTWIENQVSSYGDDNQNPTGDQVPTLTKRGDDFSERKVIFFEKEWAPEETAKISWPVEKPRPKSLKKT